MFWHVPDSSSPWQKKRKNWIFSGKRSKQPDNRELIWNRNERHLVLPSEIFLKNIFLKIKNSRIFSLNIFKKAEHRQKKKVAELKIWKKKYVTAMAKKENWRARLRCTAARKSSLIPVIRKNLYGILWELMKPERWKSDIRSMSRS